MGDWLSDIIREFKMMEGILIRIGRCPIGGLISSLIPLFDIWKVFLWHLGFEDVLPTLGVVASFALIVTAFLRVICGDWARAGFAATLLVYYIVYVPRLLLILPLFSMPLVHVGVIIIFFLIWRHLTEDPKQFEVFAGRVNFALLGLLIWTAIPLTEEINLEKQRSRASASFRDLQGEASATSPDVWHLIFDRYASIDTLKRVYGFDNEPFLTALRQRGFIVREKAFSNYPRTAHSIASTVNASSLDSLTTIAHPKDWKPLYNAISDSAAIRLFNRIGYRTIFAGGWWEPSRYSRAASESIRIRSMPELARVLLQTSYIGLGLNDQGIPWLDSRGDQCFRANEMFKKLGEIAHNSERKYVFAHFLVPHPPFVLNADGSCRSLDLAISATRSANYLAEVQFINSQVLLLVDAIISSPRPAVIVIHGDEGPFPAAYAGDDERLQGSDEGKTILWPNLSSDELNEKMGILFAFRDPSGHPPRTVPDSSVQIYPSLLRDHFGSKQSIPQSFYRAFSEGDAPYNFVDVSDRLGVR